MSPLSGIERKRRHYGKYDEIDITLKATMDAKASPMAKLIAKLTKSMAAQNLYVNQGKFSKSVKLAHDIYRTASRYHIPKFTHEVADDLFLFYSLYEFDRKKALKYANAHKKALNDYNWECKISTFRTEVILAERSSHSRKVSAQLYKRYWSEIEPQLEKVKSWQFNKTAYLFGCQYYTRIEDKENLRIIANKAITYLENFPLRSDNTLSIFYKYKLNSLHSYEPSTVLDEFITKYGTLVKKGSTNWFNYKYSLCRINLYNSSSSTSDILKEVLKSSSFKNMPDSNQAKWLVLHAYHNFMERSNLGSSSKQFSISTLTNKYSDNQFQSNAEKIQLQVITLLFYFLDKSSSRLIETSTSAIEKYVTREKLRKKDYRTYTFIKMLLAVPNNQYHPTAIKRHTKQFYKKLTLKTKSNELKLDGIEIIPYERLWEMIIDRLKR